MAPQSEATLENQLIEQLQKLNEENENLMSELIKVQSTVDFNYETKEISEFIKRYDFKNYQLAQILLKNFDDYGIM